MHKEINVEKDVPTTKQVLVSQVCGESFTHNPMKGILSKDSCFLSMNSSIFFGGSRLINSVSHIANNSTGANASDTEREPPDACRCRVGTVLAMALVALFGVLTLSIAGFVPVHYVGSRAVVRTTHLIEEEAMESVTTIMRSSILQLPDFAHIVNVKYMRDQHTTYSVDTFPANSSALLHSLMSLLRTFGGTIAYFKFMHEGGVYAFAMEYDVEANQNTSAILGAFSDRIEDTEGYLYDTAHLRRFPGGGAGRWNITWDVKGKDGPFDVVVRPWSQRGNTKRWLPSEIRHTGEYFNYVIPFEIKGSLGASVVGLSTRRLFQDSLPLIEALRSHGRVVLFDNSMRVVILNSWGEASSWDSDNSDNRLEYDFLRLDKTNDTIINAFINEFEKHRDNATDNVNIGDKLMFDFNDTEALAQIGRIKDDNDLNIMLAVVTLRSDFFAGITQARRSTLIVVLTVVCISLVVSLVVSCFLVRPVSHLVSALKRATNLEVPAHGDALLSGSHILEVRKIQMHYAKLRRQLLLLLKFVPEAILARSDTKSDRFGGAQSQSHGAASGSLGDSLPGLMSSIESNTAPFERQHGQGRDVRLNCCVFKEHPNRFVRKHCSVVAIEAHGSDFGGDYANYLGNLIEIATEHSGCVEMLDPDRALVSFGAHAALPMHNTKCCRFAFDLFSRIPPEHRHCITILIDSNEFLVGTCGAFSRNARVLFGAGYLFDLTQAFKRGSCPILSTSGVASHIQGFQAFPIDCVVLPPCSLPIVLFELRLAEKSDVSLDVVKQFKLGFAAMRQGCYKKAMSYYAPMAVTNIQARRLLKVCNEFYGRNETSPYVRVVSSRHNTGFNCVEMSGEEAGDQNASVLEKLARRKSVCRSNCEAKSPLSSDSALFSLFGSPASSETGECAEGVTAADVVPLFLTDMNQKVWTRSLNKVSEGAFSTVFLGMSEDGAQAAIKCIPRLRRDIAQESLEKEVEIASRLRHPNIVQYISCSVSPSHFSIIMEYMPGGSLRTIIENFGSISSAVARRFTIDILNGLSHLHNLGIVHCDVKPHNMLLDIDGVCKLSDFGSTVSEVSNMDPSESDGVMLRGTALYMAPEVAAGGRCTSQSDMFSFGISLLEMLLGRLPWQWSASAPVGSDVTSLRALLNRDALFVQSLALGHVEPFIPSSLGAEAAAFVRACCNPEPSKRPSAPSLLSYPFLL